MHGGMEVWDIAAMWAERVSKFMKLSRFKTKERTINLVSHEKGRETITTLGEWLCSRVETLRVRYVSWMSLAPRCGILTRKQLGWL